MLLKLIQNDLKPFLITLWRYLRKKTAASVRWVMRTPMRLIATVVVVFALIVGVHSGVDALKGNRDKGSVPQAEETNAQDEDLDYRDVEAKALKDDESASPSDGPSQSSSGTPSVGAGPQAVKTDGPSPSYEKTKVSAPSKPKVNSNDQKSVAEGFAKSYLARKDGDDQWKDWTGELTNQELKKYLSDAKTPIDSRGDTSVTDVKISDKPFDDAPKDTPIRWSRTVTATVATSQGSTLEIGYQVTMMRGDSGWQLTDAVEDGWKATNSKKKG